MSNIDHERVGGAPPPEAGAWRVHLASGVSCGDRYLIGARRQTASGRRVMTETWETPSFDEIRMDAEIGSYADEFADDRD